MRSKLKNRALRIFKTLTFCLKGTEFLSKKLKLSNPFPIFLQPDGVDLFQT